MTLPLALSATFAPFIAIGLAVAFIAFVIAAALAHGDFDWMGGYWR